MLAGLEHLNRLRCMELRGRCQYGGVDARTIETLAEIERPMLDPELVRQLRGVGFVPTCERHHLDPVDTVDTCEVFPSDCPFTGHDDLHAVTSRCL